MNPDEFEQRLRRQPTRDVPAEWRQEILAAAQAAAARRSAPDSSVRRSEARAARPSWLSTLWWPCPRAWAALAAVWVGILAVNLSFGDKPETAARQTAPAPAETIVAWRQQQRMLSQLIGAPTSLDAEPPKSVVPRPRSESSGDQGLA
jgi:hypothetical protein